MDKNKILSWPHEFLMMTACIHIDELGRSKLNPRVDACIL